MKRVVLGETMNVRDLGGYPVSGGGHTRYGVFLRSALPEGMDEAAFAYARDVLRLKTVVDLRSVEELANAPDPFCEADGVNYVHEYLAGGEIEAMLGGGITIAESYIRMSSHYESVSRIMRALISSSGAALVHCAAGKDRTGVVCAILLMSAGVCDDDIVADYQLSNTYIQRLVRMLGDSVPERICSSYPETMREFLPAFRERYGDAVRYLREIGLSESEVGALHIKLVGD